jgi:hypothetical protein
MVLKGVRFTEGEKILLKRAAEERYGQDHKLKSQRFPVHQLVALPNAKFRHYFVFRFEE